MPEGPVIEQMFRGIAPRYDLANHVLSFGLDFGWRRRLVRAVAMSLGGRDAAPRRPPGSPVGDSAIKLRTPRRGVPTPDATPDVTPDVNSSTVIQPLVVDLATGSGDVAFALKKRLGPDVDIRGLDFCRPMLEVAEQKKAGQPWARDITFALGDCLDLPLADDSVDALTIAWGLRNLADRARGLAEMHRVLRPGGKLFILDNSQPEGWTAPFARFYLNAVVPAAGGLLTGQPEAYRYLATSTAAFPSRAALALEIAAAGFVNIHHKALGLGAVALHEAVK